MRTPMLLLATLALAATACQCGDKKLSTLAPNLVVIQPTAKEADTYLIDFGTVHVGETVSKQIVIDNRGNADATISTRTLRAGSSERFSLSGSEAPKGLGIAGSFVVNVDYHPTQTGDSTGFVDITTSDTKLPSVTVKLIAKAQAGAVEVCAETTTSGAYECVSPDLQSLVIDYGSSLLNKPAISRKIRLRNLGNAPLRYLGTAFVDPTSLEFRMEPDQSSALTDLAPSDEHEFAVTFTPSLDDTVTGVAQVVTDDPTQPIVNVYLKATAAAAVTCKLTVNPTSVAFGAVPTDSSQETTVTVTNAGTLPCNISSITKTGSSNFVLTGTATKLDPKASAQLKVRYAPSGNSNDTGSLVIDSDDPANPRITVPLSGSGVEQPDCILVAKPTTLDFGGIELGDRSIRSVGLTVQGSGICTLLSARLSTPNSNFIMSPVTFGVVAPSFGGIGGAQVGLTYAPTVARSDSTSLVITYQAGLFSGPTLTINIPIIAKSGTKRLCVHPQRLHFGAVPVNSSKSLTFTMTACGGAAITVRSMRVVTGAPFSLNPVTATPLAIAAGASATQTVVASPTTSANFADAVEITTDDPNFPRQLVPLDMGPETVSADAGEVMYTWQAAAITTTQEGTVMKTNLQGPPNRSAFYGSKVGNGQACSGCHAVSPDGKYVALIEYGTSPTMRIVDARTGGTVPLPNTMGGQFPSWNPNIKTTPPYQFVYNDGNVLKIASMTAGVLGELNGANNKAKIQTQPSWGPNGTIAFVSGIPGTDGGEFGIGGPADLMIIPESGGTAVAVPGASGTKAENYMPEFSPNGKYIAYTYSEKGDGTRSAKDSVVRLVEVATGTILKLPQLNAAGPNSWPTWSKDGKLLSFSSTRSGGKGSADIYYAPVDQETGVDGPAVNMSNVNTSDYDHISRWAPLPPP